MAAPEDRSQDLSIAESPAAVRMSAFWLVLLATLVTLIVLYELITWQPVGSANSTTGVPPMFRAL